MKNLRINCQFLLIKIKDSSFIELMPLVRERVRTWKQVVDLLRFWYLEKIIYDKKRIGNITTLLKKYSALDTPHEIFKQLKKTLSSLKEWSQESWEKNIRFLADNLVWKHGDLFMLLRLIIVGEKYSLPLRESMLAIGRIKSLNRIDLCLKSIINE